MTGNMKFYFKNVNYIEKNCRSLNVIRRKSNRIYDLFYLQYYTKAMYLF